jgi:hypothetical protein
MNLDEIFTVKTANEWLQESKGRPIPKMLFGEFWLEGEVSILFADTGKGKSILAVHIAESIARGRGIEPMVNTAPAQTVLYLDFELTAKQFEMRYSADPDPAAKDGFLHRHYKFSPKFCRVEINLHAKLPDGFASFDDYLHTSIEMLLQQTQAKILIVDNVTYLKRSNETTREALPLMKELKRLNKKLGISILVLAHTPKRLMHRPITINDLQGSKVLSNFADNIFAIGESRRLGGERYVKQIKQRSTELMYNSAHVPVFDIRKIDGNFLGFQFYGYERESALLLDGHDLREWESIEKIGKMAAQGMSLREIAESLALPKSTVHRKVHMFQQRGR